MTILIDTYISQCFRAFVGKSLVSNREINGGGVVIRSQQGGTITVMRDGTD